LQTGFRVGPRLIATGRTLIANGIAIIGIVPTLIATGAGAWRAGKRPVSCRYRHSPDGVFEHHPALLCALSDVRTSEQCGI
jgi:hypothetical protein